MSRALKASSQKSKQRLIKKQKVKPKKAKRNVDVEDKDSYISDHPNHNKHNKMINDRLLKSNFIMNHLRARGTKPQGTNLCTKDIKVREPKMLRSMMRNILKIVREDPKLKKMNVH